MYYLKEVSAKFHVRIYMALCIFLDMLLRQYQILLRLEFTSEGITISGQYRNFLFRQSAHGLEDSVHCAARRVFHALIRTPY